MAELVSTQRNRIPPSRRIDRPLVAYWLLAYAIAWSVFGLLDVTEPARRGKRPRALAYGQSIQFASASLGVPAWVVYLLT